MSDLYHKINDFIINKGVKTITLDIFDTVLMRDTWPEDIQFYEVAKKWQPLFKKYTDANIPVEQIWSYRNYVRREIIDAKYRYEDKDNNNAYTDAKVHDVNLDSWFEALVDVIMDMNNIKLPPPFAQSC